MIAIGASTGGTEAILAVLSKLPNQCQELSLYSICRAHSPRFCEGLIETQNLVVEATNGEVVEAGKVYLAPGEQHMLWRAQIGAIVFDSMMVPSL